MKPLCLITSRCSSCAGASSQPVCFASNNTRPCVPSHVQKRPVQASSYLGRAGIPCPQMPGPPIHQLYTANTWHFSLRPLPVMLLRPTTASQSLHASLPLHPTPARAWQHCSQLLPSPPVTLRLAQALPLQRAAILQLHEAAAGGRQPARPLRPRRPATSARRAYPARRVIAAFSHFAPIRRAGLGENEHEPGEEAHAYAEQVDGRCGLGEEPHAHQCNNNLQVLRNRHKGKRERGTEAEVEHSRR